MSRESITDPHALVAYDEIVGKRDRALLQSMKAREAGDSAKANGLMDMASAYDDAAAVLKGAYE